MKTGYCRGGVLIGALCSIVLAACGGSSSNTSTGARAGVSIFTGAAPGGTPQRGGTLQFSSVGEPKTLDPPLLNAANQNAAMLPIFDQLTEVVPGSSDPQPGLASSWSISEDGLTYDFQLRPNVKFSDGTRLTSSDVVFSINRVISLVKQGKTNGIQVTPDTFKTISAPAADKVRLVLKQVKPSLLGDLANVQLSVVSKASVEKLGPQAFGQKPIGSGPFAVNSFSPGTSEQLVRNTHYWRSGQPYLDGVNFRFIPDANQRILTVRSGESDVADNVPFPQIPSLKNLAGKRLLIQPFFNSDVGNWNTKIAPFNDQKVRRALNYAIPRDAIIKDVYRGYAEASNSIIPKLDYWDSKVPVYPYNIEKAKQILATSSRPKGFSTTIYIPGGDAQLSLLASILQSSWKKIGVNARIRQLDFGTFLSDALAGKEPVFLFSSGGFTSNTGAPDSTANLAYDYDRGNHALATNFDNEQEKRLVRRALSSTDEKVRRESFQKLQRLAYDYAQMMPFAFTPSVSLLRDRVRGFSVMPTGWIRLEQVWLATAGNN